MRALVTGGAGFIGSHVVEALARARRRGARRGRSLEGQARAGARCRDAARARHPRAARCDRPRERSAGDRAPRCPGRRPGLCRGPRVRCGGQRSRHRQRARGRPPRRRSGRCSRRRAGRSTASASGRLARATRAFRSLPTAPRSSPARDTSAHSGASTTRRTSRCGSATSTDHARIRMARQAWWRSFSGGCATERHAGSSATGRRAATTSTSRTWSARRGRARWRLEWRVQRRHRRSQRRCWSSTTICRSTVGTDAAPVHEAARPGELGRSVLDGELAATTLGFRPEIALASGIATTWESIRSDR